MSRRLINFFAGMGSILSIFPTPLRSKTFEFHPPSSVEEAWAKDKKSLRKDYEKVFGTTHPPRK